MGSAEQALVTLCQEAKRLKGNSYARLTHCLDDCLNHQDGLAHTLETMRLIDEQFFTKFLKVLLQHNVSYTFLEYQEEEPVLAEVMEMEGEPYTRKRKKRSRRNAKPNAKPNLRPASTRACSCRGRKTSEKRQKNGRFLERSSANKWSNEESEKLMDLVKRYADHPNKWSKIASKIPSKSNWQCSQRYNRVLNPVLAKGEEQTLLNLVKELGTSWNHIAERMGHRSDIQCRYQYVKLKESMEVEWTDDEDEYLRKQVDLCGTDWKKVASFGRYTGTYRSALQCKLRWRIISTSSDSKATDCTSFGVHSVDE